MLWDLIDRAWRWPGWTSTQRQTAAYTDRWAGDAERGQAVHAYVGYDAFIHAARAVRRPLRRYWRLAPRAAQIAAEFEDMGCPDVKPGWLKAIEPLVATFIALVVSAMLAPQLLESGGTIPSLSIFDSTLPDWLIYGLAAAAGAVFVFVGHGIGTLIARTAKGRSRRAKIAVASAAVSLTAVVVAAILATGLARDVNMNATGKVQQAAVLQAGAAQLDQQADELERPVQTKSRPRRIPATARREAKTKRAQAQQQRKRADALTTQAFAERTLWFFIPLQLAGLALSIFGGWAWAETADMRRMRTIARRHARWERRLSALSHRIWRCVCEVVGTNQRTAAHGDVVSGRPHTPSNPDLCEVVFWRLMNPPTSDPRTAPSPFPPRGPSNNGHGDSDDLPNPEDEVTR
jgi:hypothetical protein